VVQVYNRSITDPAKLKRYKGWSEEVVAGGLCVCVLSVLSSPLHPVYVVAKMHLGLWRVFLHDSDGDCAKGTRFPQHEIH
jgi:hypothetical protein